MLQGLFGLDVKPGTVPLADFQREAVSKAMRMIQYRGGVLIADGTGMGKTYIGLGIAELSKGPVLLLAPASLRSMWRKEISRFCLGETTVLSHQALAAGRRPAARPSLIIVDEAHTFRNPATRRYRALRSLTRSSKIALLTATPVNNSLSDLYFLLALFCADGAFRDIGVGSLRAALTGTELRLDDIERIRRAVMIRRSRTEIGPGLSFPANAVTRAVTYAPPVAFTAARQFIESLAFPAHHAAPGKEQFAPELLRFALLKRFDSSREAIAITLRRQINFYEQFVAALHGGVLFEPRVARRTPGEDEGVFQLEMTAVVGAAITECTGLLQQSTRELALLREWYALLPDYDDKLDTLIHLLRERRDAKTIVFTEYRDTARYLWRNLRNRFPTGLIDGSGAWLGANPSHRREVVERFAPHANRARIQACDNCSVLIATDVLAEGMNLQDADAVVSYDLPWNPVRLIQRFGRVDRMGSPHESVTAFNFMPDHELDAMIRLVHRLRFKLEAVRTVVGLDGPVLDSEIFELSAPAPVRGALAELRRIYVEPEPVGAIPVAAVGAGTTYVAVHRGSDCAFFQDAGSGPREIPLGEVPLIQLRQALATTEVRTPDLEPIAKTVAAVLAELRSRNDLAAVGRSAPAARIAHLIRTRASQLPLAESADIYLRIDATLDGLTRFNSAAADEALMRVARGSFGSLQALLDAVNDALVSTDDEKKFNDEWRVTGVLVAD